MISNLSLFPVSIRFSWTSRVISNLSIRRLFVFPEPARDLQPVPVSHVYSLFLNPLVIFYSTSIRLTSRVFPPLPRPQARVRSHM